MYYFRFMADGDDAGGNMGGQAAGPADESAPEETVTPQNPAGDGEEAETGGTTPEEVSQILRGAGMDVKVPAPAAPADNEEEETPSEEETPAEEPAAEETPAEEPAKPETKPEEVKPEAPQETPEFVLTVVDDDGQTFKVAAGEDLDEALDKANLTDTAQVRQIMRDMNALEDKKAAYEADQEKAAEDARAAEDVARIVETWNKEYDDLVASKQVDAKDEGRKDAILAHMREVNDQRQEAGKPLMSSLEDAYNSLARKEAAEAAVAKAKEAKETARRNGALVGGASAPATSGPPVYRAGSAMNINQAIKAQGLL